MREFYVASVTFLMIANVFTIWLLYKAHEKIKNLEQALMEIAKKKDV